MGMPVVKSTARSLSAKRPGKTTRTPRLTGFHSNHGDVDK
ncbi:hypothetical protein Nizo1840_1190 [Lactiplantibacillus plantarum]|nr:hypothetical protein SF2A35B_0895 [Lactiplantibacillus plantarum]KZT84833.1 hypothetical protein Nizo1840_1190 [Lactiplantibacillus plantarum]KZU10320.1 hypothetical protein Nizo2264_2928 [Lactiplantibacillus plantarum]